VNKINKQIIIGLRDADGDGVQEKDDGTPLGGSEYNNWNAPGFMYNTCTVMGTASMFEMFSNKWNNVDCSDDWHCYVCEKEGSFIKLLAFLAILANN